MMNVSQTVTGRTFSRLGAFTLLLTLMILAILAVVPAPVLFTTERSPNARTSTDELDD